MPPDYLQLLGREIRTSKPGDLEYLFNDPGFQSVYHYTLVVRTVPEDHSKFEVEFASREVL